MTEPYLAAIGIELYWLLNFTFQTSISNIISSAEDLKGRAMPSYRPKTPANKIVKHIKILAVV